MRLQNKVFIVFAGILISVSTVVGLYIYSERIIHHHNNFIRRFPQHVAYQKQEIELTYNSYYFAGVDGDKVYLGNLTTPLYITVLNIKSGSRQKHQIQIDSSEVKLKGPRIKIFGDSFYLFEGNAPYIFKGKTTDWKGTVILTTGQRFSILEPTEDEKIILRYEKPITGEGVLGLLNLRSAGNPVHFESLLESQGNAFFDTDGTLAYDRQTQKLVYTYYYRNQFLVTHNDLKLHYSGNTIDTVSNSQIALETLKDGRQTFANPPLTVNRITTADGGLLFINSMLPGQYDSDAMWKTASIIDVYDLTDRTYRSSFPIYNLKGKKLRSMLVDGQNLCALIDTQLIIYGLRNNLKALNKIEKSGK